MLVLVLVLCCGYDCGTVTVAAVSSAAQMWLWLQRHSRICSFALSCINAACGRVCLRMRGCACTCTYGYACATAQMFLRLRGCACSCVCGCKTAPAGTSV